MKNIKKDPGLWEQRLDRVHLCVKFCIQNIVSGVSRKKTPKCFFEELFVLVFLTKFLSKCSNSTILSLSLLQTWKKYFDPLTVITLLGLSFCYRIGTNSLGQITSWGRP